MTETVKIRVSISTNKVGSECTDEMEWPREEWDALNDAQKEEVARDLAFNSMEWNWEIVDGDN